MLFSDVLSLVSENYVDPVETESLVEGAYESMMASLDARGAFLTPEEVREWTASPGDDSAGPGVSVLKVYGALQVVAVHARSAAEAAGLAVGDQIRRIDDRDLRELSWDQCLRLLHGEPGSTVRLQIVHPDETFRSEELELTRGPRADRAHDVEVRDGIALLTVRDLARADPEQIASDLDDVAGRGIGRLLLDLRNLADGSPEDAASLAGLFGPGEAFRLRDREGRVTVTAEATGGAPVWSGSVGVLVNGATAGGGEALARFLQVTVGAPVLGEATFGLGTEVELFRMPDGSGVLVSTARWELAGGEVWTPDGVTPDVPVRPRGRDIPARLADQLEQALSAFAEHLDEAEAAEREAA